MAKVADAKYYMTRNTKAALDSNNAVYNSGHRILETDTESTKTGNGTDTYTALPYDYGYQKLESGSLSSTGWYTIAELPSGGQFGAMGGLFSVGFLQGHLVFRVGLANRGGSGGEERFIEVLGYSGNTRGGGSTIWDARIAKSDSVATAGAKVQVYIDATASGSIITVFTNENSSRTSANQQLSLVAPYLDNTPTLPDGITSGTFIVAGEEYKIDLSATGTIIPPTVSGRRISDNVVDVTIDFGEYIRNNITSLALTLPSTTFNIYDGSGNVNSPTGGTYTLITVREKRLLSFRWTETNIGLGMNNGALAFAMSGGSFSAKLS